jgi:hypothetical protein
VRWAEIEGGSDGFAGEVEEFVANSDEFSGGSCETSVELSGICWRLVNFQLKSDKGTACSHDFCLGSFELWIVLVNSSLVLLTSVLVLSKSLAEISSRLLQELNKLQAETQD